MNADSAEHAEKKILSAISVSSAFNARLGPALIVLAIGGALVPIPPRAVERVYSRSMYAALQPLVTSASNLIPLALLDVLIVAAIGCWAWLATRDIRRRRHWVHAALRIVTRTVLWSAAAYLLFLLTWGLNYRRVRLVDTLQFEAASVTTGSARQAAAATVDQLSRLHDAAHARGWPAAGAIDRELAAAFAAAVDDVEGPTRLVVARPKRTLLDWYFRRAGVDGMTDPFFLETLVVADALPFERPFIFAHEWSHLAGIADEGEANFVGWLACVRGSDAHRYSGALFLYAELARSLDDRDRAALAAGLASGPRQDLRAIRDRALRQINPRVAAAGWRVYDSYLKANRVEAGAASYAEVVRLVLGVKFADGMRPIRR